MKTMSTQEANPFKDAQRWNDLPIISLEKWFSGTPAEKREVAQALYKGATGCGFFYVVDHGIDQTLIAAVYSQSQRFHVQSEPWKDKYNINKSLIHRGWVSSEETLSYEKDGKIHNNYHESFDISYEVPASDPRVSEGYGMIGPNVWPDLGGFQETVSTYYDAIYRLGRAMLAAFELSLELTPDTFLKYVTLPTSQLRLLKYYENEAPSDELNVGISAHSDFECFTILHTSTPGLQVMSSEDHWVEAPPVEGAFLVNVGDCLESWTGGLFKATQHRVINLGKERYSLPLFFATDFDVEIKPLPQFSTDLSREKYPPFIAGEHLWGRTIDTFPYLKRKYDSGELIVDFDIPDENPFKRVSLEERNKKDTSSSEHSRT
jgi:isopenicillin N synthase-like dioxygenase